jgi:Spy/CpxP family protein refolding chaperone
MTEKLKEVHMKKVLVGLVFGSLLLAFASYNAFAEMRCCMDRPTGGRQMRGEMNHRGIGMMGAEHRMWEALKGLGLDEKQSGAIQEIKGRVTKDTIRKGADVRIGMIELKEMLDKDPVDINAVEAKLKQIGAVKTDLILSHIKAREEVKTHLTSDQKNMFKEKLEKQDRWMRDGKRKAQNGKKKGEMQSSVK